MKFYFPIFQKICPWVLVGIALKVALGVVDILTVFYFYL
jgi:hypothetical protein